MQKPYCIRSLFCRNTGLAFRMSSPLISNQSVTVQLPATDNVEKLKELLAEALKLQLEDYEVFHNGQQVFSNLTLNC